MEIIPPLSEDHWREMRSHDITSTEISALFGCNPYMTLFELWHSKKKAEVVEIEEHERMRWGKRLQDAIAKGIAEDQGWSIRPMTEYIRNPDYRLGASFDYAIEPGGILEIKNVDALRFRGYWVTEGDDVEAPLHIEFQLQQQMLLSGRMHGHIGALIGGNTVRLLKRDANFGAWDAILSKARDFWTSIDENRPPPPSYPRDSEAVIKMYQHSEPGKVIDADDNSELLSLAEEYRAAAEKAKEAEEQKRATKAKLLAVMGDAEKARSELFTISAGLIGPKKIEAHVRSGYRDFRINWRKK